jgi:predicted nucleic acid-binding protein
MISFDTNVLVYATAALADDRLSRAQDLSARAMRATTGILLLQSLAEFSKCRNPQSAHTGQRRQKDDRSWLAVLPVQPADDTDVVHALEAVHAHRLPFWAAMLWALAQRSGVRHMLSEDFEDGFELKDVTFINPFNPKKSIDCFYPARG